MQPKGKTAEGDKWEIIRLALGLRNTGLSSCDGELTLVRPLFGPAILSTIYYNA